VASTTWGSGRRISSGRCGKRAPGEAPPEGAILHYALRTTDCDAALERARAAGATVTMEPKTIPLESEPQKITIRIAFCKGPDGELIEFFQNDQT
jgi:glyoxylase I family protein